MGLLSRYIAAMMDLSISISIGVKTIVISDSTKAEKVIGITTTLVCGILIGLFSTVIGLGKGIVNEYKKDKRSFSKELQKG